jgi:hypothetical protein
MKELESTYHFQLGYGHAPQSGDYITIKLLADNCVPFGRFFHAENAHAWFQSYHVPMLFFGNLIVDDELYQI